MITNTYRRHGTNTVLYPSTHNQKGVEVSTPWKNFADRWKNCTDCPLCEQRDRIVLARGSVPCDVLLIGEAPGESENILGIPFCGPAGKLLDDIIDRALPKGTRYALTNLVCCFPRDAKHAGTNEPAPDEISACQGRLVEFINLCKPKLIVCVGLLAADWIDHGAGIECADIVHPAAILRMPLAQRQMALQKAIVVLRNAVEDTVNFKCQQFTNRGDIHASSKSHSYHTEADIPF